MKEKEFNLSEKIRNTEYIQKNIGLNVKMRKCCVCKRNIWFWNRFYRKYGFCRVLNKKTLKPEGIIYFCSMNCYEKTLTIQEKQSNIFFNFFKKSDENWISVKK